ncbi:class I SAM-dependent methyltransferase [Reyranella sp.]|uniref:class I SAM-dependent methyltransferase n=1 Tax=Reyranella sp. TaxID=1929291 RepID=UPI003BAAC910
MKYLEFLGHLHSAVDPNYYVEIGIRNGAALSRATKFAVGIDPRFQITFPFTAFTKLFRSTSDDFFQQHDLRQELGGNAAQLAFIDGFHNFEFALRDFMNVERNMTTDGIIVVDDVRPRTVREAQRAPTGGAWTGDVWKLYFCLKQYRPDLEIICAGTEPTGLLLVRKLNPASNVIAKNYDKIVAEYLSDEYGNYPDSAYLEGFDEPEDILKKRFKFAVPPSPQNA